VLPFAKHGAMAEHMLVVGGGTMGAGIALVGARAGYRVELVEPQTGARERGREYLEREASRSGETAALDRIEWIERVPARSDAAFAIEAVPERFELKREVFTALAESLSDDALLASNTSSLSIDELADVTAHPERVLGLHFFNPAPRMELVEIVRGDQTSDEAAERAADIVARLGKTAVFAADTPGFIVNRVARPYYLQALRALERGVASAAELDALARGAGFRMGPFELMDLIGLDVNLATSQSVYERTEAKRLAPVALQREMVSQNLLGRKTGAGFYQYNDGRARRFEPKADGEVGDLTGELIAIVGFGGVADEIAEALGTANAEIARIENDEFIDQLSPDATVVIDVGDGSSDRREMLEEIDAALGPHGVIFADAYATDLAASAAHLRHPERLVGYGILGSLDGQRAVEIVDGEDVSDEALELAQEIFALAGKAAVLVEDLPGLFLGRTIGSVVNEAMYAIAERVATPDDVDTAMRLGANYPMGPVTWGREIGGARVARILSRLAEAEGEEFAPYRSLWVLDAETPEPEGA
jgi:3-hydroxybutyryl-CoA dehydrogenase